MSIEEMIGLAAALFLMCFGLAGSVLPWLPSTPLIFLTALAHRLYFGESGAGWIVMTILLLLTLLSLVLDHLAGAYGARRFGATWKGVAGAIVGGIVGLFFSLPGLLLGPFVGAVLFELIGGRAIEDSSRAGVGATVGMLLGAIGKVACCVSMMALFTANVLWRNLADGM
jgi:uncharacterized protein YqgC (DUF456 family)